MELLPQRVETPTRQHVVLAHDDRREHRPAVRHFIRADFAEDPANLGAEVGVVHVDAEHLRELAVVDESAGAGSFDEGAVDGWVLHR